MIIIKTIMLILISTLCIYIGNLISLKYKNRLIDLIEIKNALSMFEKEIQFTFETIPQIFTKISERTKDNISQLFLISAANMEKYNAQKAWNIGLDKLDTSMNKEDIRILRKLGNLLGKIDIDGQVGEIKLVMEYINTQITIAQDEKNKYSKLYKTLGATIGLAIMIILI